MGVVHHQTKIFSAQTTINHNFIWLLASFPLLGIAFDNQTHFDLAAWKKNPFWIGRTFFEMWIEGESKIYQPQQLITNHEQEQKITPHHEG